MNIDFKKIRGIQGHLAVWTGTALGAGFFPKAPGTMGALVAVPLAYFSNTWDLAPRVALWLGLTLAGTWAAKVLDEQMGSADNQSVVMDEVVGLGITAWTAGTNWTALWVSFFLFRAFDILKPPPVRQLDRWSKNKAAGGQSSASSANHWWGGFGVMADDIVAGFQGLIIMLLLQYFGVLSFQ